MAYSCWPRLFACHLAFFLISGCSTQSLQMRQRVPVYAGPLKSIDEVGVFLPVQLVGLHRVDGTKVADFKRPDIPWGAGGLEIELLPGIHKLEYDYGGAAGNFKVHSISSQVRMIKVEAGHIYLARDAGGHGYWDVQIDDVTEKERANLAARRSAAPSN